MTATTVRIVDAPINGHIVHVSTDCADTSLAELLRWTEKLEDGLRAGDSRDALKTRLALSHVPPVRKMRQPAQQPQAQAKPSQSERAIAHASSMRAKALAHGCYAAADAYAHDMRKLSDAVRVGACTVDDALGAIADGIVASSMRRARARTR